MRIDPNDTIAGFGAMAVREALARVRGQPFTEAELEVALGPAPGPGSVAPPIGTVLEGLEAEGYVEAFVEGGESRDRGLWKVTLAGNALCNARAGRPIRREVAQRHLDAFLERAREVNASGRWLFWVERVLLFGSMLDPGKETVSDVDLAVDLAPREGQREAHRRKMTERAEEAARMGHRFINLTEEATWGQVEVHRFLKGRSPYVSLTDTGDEILRIAPSETIYEREREKAGREKAASSS